jgi:hypothetical protein
MLSYGQRAIEHDGQQGLLWRVCLLQTYFAAKGLINYFIISEDGNNNSSLGLSMRPKLEPEQPE